MLLSTSTNATAASAAMESTLDVVAEDSVAVHSVKTTGGVDVENPELSDQGLEKKSSTGSSVVRNASKLKRLALLTTSVGRFDRTKSAVVHALKGLKFISKTDGGATSWAEVEKRFDELTAKTNGSLPRSLFGECIGMKESKEFACMLFDALGRRKNISGDSINKRQLREYWDQISDQTLGSRLQTFFDMVDKDADGRITEEEMREIIILSASVNKLSNIQKQADEYARQIMEKLDPDELGYIMIENLKTRLLQDPSESVRADDSPSLSKMLSQKLKPTQDYLVKRWYRDFKYLLLDNWQRVWVMALWIGIMAGLFAYKYVQYKNKAVFGVIGHCVCLAKGSAETLKLNMALILLPVCRKTITWLRNKTILGKAFPFDDYRSFHKLIAIAIVLGTGMHGLSHLTCDFPHLLHATPEEYEPMEQFFGEQPTSYWFFVKGWESVTGIIMVVLMAIAFTLASPWFRTHKIQLPKRPLDKLIGFRAFWYSHHLFVIVYSLLIIHGIKLYLIHEWYEKTTWMYLAVPIVLYAGERLIRSFRSRINAVKILKSAVFPGDVLTLHMSKPQGFKYKSGQYIFVKCAAVSPFEWHPFSITSAPGDDYISVHIRTHGNWTRQLYEVCKQPTRESGLLKAHFLQGENNPNFPKVLIDGPYGAPTQDYKNYDVVLLVGLGIGATPMISVVKDVVNNMKAMEEEENSLEEGNIGGKIMAPNSSPSTNKTRRVYFYWVTREQGSFDWFKGVMNEVAETDHKGIIEMHNYCTSVYEEGDARSALITMLQSLNHAKNGVDVVSGTRVKSHFAKPNWRMVYKRISLKHPNSRVGVFYCGPPAAAKELRQLASDFSQENRTKFEFHKENF